MRFVATLTSVRALATAYQKSQNPIPKTQINPQTPIFKYREREVTLDDWELKVPWDLDLGIWKFLTSARSIPACLWRALDLRSLAGTAIDLKRGAAEAIPLSASYHTPMFRS